MEPQLTKEELKLMVIDIIEFIKDEFIDIKYINWSEREEEIKSFSEWMIDQKLEEIFDRYINHDDFILFRVNRLIVEKGEVDNLIYWIPWHLNKKNSKNKLIYPYNPHKKIKKLKGNYLDMLFKDEKLFAIKRGLKSANDSKFRLDFRDIITLNHYRLNPPSNGFVECIKLDEEKQYMVIEVNKIWLG